MGNGLKTADGCIRILLVEDDTEDRSLIIRDLKPLSCGYEVECAESLQEAIQLMTLRTYDLVLLDLGLSDSQGLDTFVRLHETAPQVPFVIFTGQEDDETVMLALKAGAQDYLVKGQTDRRLLHRSIRYSVERQRLLLSLERERLLREQEHERRALESLAAPPTTSVTNCLYDSKPLREAAREAFEQMVERYATLLNKALDRRIYKYQASQRGELRKIAEEIGAMHAGPRDALDMHLDAMKRTCDGQPVAKIKALNEEGRFLLIELMGYLVSFYRNYYPGCSRVLR